MKIFSKVVSGMLALSMCGLLSINFTSLKVNALSDNYKKGDVDGNNIVNSIDSAYLRNFLHGIKKSANNGMTQRLDINLDGIINSDDETELSNIIVGNSGTTNFEYAIVNNDIPNSTSQSYQKYNAQSGIAMGNSYTLNALTSIPDYASTYSIIDEDTRQIDYYNPGIVKISSSIGSGTGFVVDNHTILTAAHCLYYNNQFATNVNYTLYAFNGSSAGGVHSAVTYHIPVNFIGNSSVTYDYAIITVSENLGNKAFDLGVARKYLNNKNPKIYVSGYSGEASSTRPELTGEMVTGEGYLTGNKVYNNYIEYDTDTVHGTSGAPVYVKTPEGHKIVIGIHRGPASTGNYGHRIDSNVLQFVYNNSELTW